jgi:protocatechuate 3,4-dioxygenase beta subunit
MANYAAAQKITDTVLTEYRDKISNPRLQAVMESLITHLHQFAQDIELSEQEWGLAIGYLTRTGQMCDDKRQEFILLSDILGLSMVVDAINCDNDGMGTENTVLGPFHVEGAPSVEYGGSIIRTEQPQGEVVLVRGRVVDTQGNAIAGARLDTWSTGGNARYFVQDADVPAYNMYGIVTSQDDGSYGFVSELPVCYPIPTDGPVGELLNACNRKEMRPAHMHFIVSADGYHKLQTHLFADDDPYLDSDAVFALKDELIVRFEKSTDAGLAAQFGLPAEYRTLDFDFVLLPE